MENWQFSGFLVVIVHYISATLRVFLDTVRLESKV